MLEPEEVEKLEAHHKISMKIWIALLASLGLYLSVCFTLPEGERSRSPEDLTVMKNALIINAIIILAAAYLIRRFHMKRKCSDPNNMDTCLQGYRTSLIVSLALGESVALYGLILYYLGAAESTLLIFMGMSAACMVYFRPTFSQLEAYVLHQKSLVT